MRRSLLVSLSMLALLLFGVMGLELVLGPARLRLASLQLPNRNLQLLAALTAGAFAAALLARKRPLTATSRAVLAGLLAASAMLVNTRLLGSGDTRPAAYLPFAIVRTHSLSFETLIQQSGCLREPDGSLPYWFVPWEGRTVSKYPLMMGLLALPIELPSTLGTFDVCSKDFNDLEKIAATILAALGVVFLFWTFEKLVNLRAAALAAFFYVMGTPVSAHSRPVPLATHRRLSRLLAGPAGFADHGGWPPTECPHCFGRGSRRCVSAAGRFLGRRLDARPPRGGPSPPDGVPGRLGAAIRPRTLQLGHPGFAVGHRLWNRGVSRLDGFLAGGAGRAFGESHAGPPAAVPGAHFWYRRAGACSAASFEDAAIPPAHGWCRCAPCPHGQMVGLVGRRRAGAADAVRCAPHPWSRTRTGRADGPRLEDQETLVRLSRGSLDGVGVLGDVRPSSRTHQAVDLENQRGSLELARLPSRCLPAGKSGWRSSASIRGRKF